MFHYFFEGVICASTSERRSQVWILHLPLEDYRSEKVALASDLLLRDLHQGQLYLHPRWVWWMELRSSTVLAHPGKVTLAWNTQYFGQRECGMWMRCSRRTLGMQTAHGRWCQQRCASRTRLANPVGNLQTIPRPWLIPALGCVSLHSLICAFLPHWENPS